MRRAKWLFLVIAALAFTAAPARAAEDGGARVEHVDVRWRGYTGEYSDFQIVE